MSGKRERDWLFRIFNGCFREKKVPREWKSTCIVPLYKGKGDRLECANYGTKSLQNVIEKVYGGIVIEHIKNSTDGAIGEDQCA